ncbi:alcohol dehydrogenase [Chelatococcus reniformis]|uniref:alcohol dehydrogenase n=1 Tax=Chelatococcus reniformis TaxID=1494448 RepID=A0A916URY2_9HYPH|nr:alcohol dehydrogenase [Chelatococcus reniformis]GGC84402.1 NAD-dependent alcohol dehydrogenase [Chelatococcus reniformis]
MRSYRLKDFEQPLETVDEDTPTPEGTQVLLRVKAAGVCHSDIHIWEGSYDLGGGRKMAMRGIPLPLTMGHETVGEVIAAGPEAEGVKAGDVRVVFPWIGCGKCALCQAGDEHLCNRPRALGVVCDGGYADHIVVPHPRYLLAIDGVDPAVAAPYACSGLTTFSALKKLEHVFKDEPIMIIGAGGLGLMALTLLKALGGKGAVVVDIDAKKREAALAAGALAAVDGAAPDAVKQATAAAGGGLRGVVDLVGNTQSTSLGFDALGKGGKLVIVGLFGGAAAFALPMFPIKAATVQGSFVGSLSEFHQLMELVRAGAVPAVPLIRRPLAEVGQTLEDLRGGRIVGRAVLTP